MDINRLVEKTPSLAPVSGPFASVQLKISFAGKVLQSTLWYAYTNPNNGSAAQVAANLGSTLDLGLLPSWMPVCPIGSLAFKLDIMVFSTGWLPLLSTPVEFAVNVAGTATTNCSGRAHTANVFFTLDYTQGQTVANREKPARTYVQVGPLHENAVNSDNAINYTGWNAGVWTAFQNAVIADYGGNNGETFIPIRVGSENDAGEHAWAPVSGCYLPDRSGTRKSRNKL